ncbi:MAG TPA: BTAD domain-containing putative transcriptional regulator [Burkholderiales bacterium]|nr:BTAD domain-containing putative transcriptional regulator [Burkholderiales bacterium]
MGTAVGIPAVEARLLGPLSVARAGSAVVLPGSRKLRALFGYLALAPQPVTRSHLCELFWDGPSDPRAELRWCLSRIRGIADTAERRRVLTQGDTVALDLADCFVDAREIARALQDGVEALAPERLRSLSALFAGDLLDGLDIEGSPLFGGWLVAQRRRFRGYHAAILERLVGASDDEQVFSYLDAWLRLAPFDLHAHAALLHALARRGRVRESEEHVATAARLFDSEGLDATPLHEAWQAARSRAESAPQVRVEWPSETLEPGAAGEPRRASIAVMPFNETGDAPGGFADGLVHDIITRLAKLRSLFVIARGSVFALHERKVSPEEAGRALNVDYVASGSLRRRGDRLVLSVELAESRTARIVWAEVFDQKTAEALAVLDDVGNRIVASIAHEIETIERNRALLRPPGSLDAWQAYHRGLWHMYRFNTSDNERAQHFFRTAVRLDPTFARAHAALSFTHFQNAFQGWGPRAPEIERAYAVAGHALMADDLDPAAHWAMGRALWLRESQDQAIVELERAIDLSPNFALAHYTLSFVQCQSGDARAAIRASDHSRHLSPFDPLLFAMLGARAMALVRLGRFDEAAEWAAKAAARPNAHAHIQAIAAYSLALAGRVDDARGYLKALPQYRIEDFLTAMRFDDAGAKLFREAAKRIGRP